ncbi:MAG TPA: PDZ domain-containing protein [Candidatus Binatia bacterium]|nr:PDZ domain-containing protein [Candidatus Binatia bacterium]
MKRNRMFWCTVLAATLAAGTAWAGDDGAKVSDEARRNLDQARKEVERAREELSKATRELARSLAKVDRDNPKAQYFEYMTDPKRAMLGVIVDDDSADAPKQGVRVLAVTPGGGADKAGLKAGDLMVGMNGKPLTGDERLSAARRMRDQMRQVKAGDEVRLEIERDGKRRTVAVLTTGPEDDVALFAPPTALFEDLPEMAFGPMPGMPMLHFRGAAVQGLELAKLDEDLAWYFKTKEGVLVLKPAKSSVLKLRSGDVIQRIDGDGVSEPITVLDKLHGGADERTVKVQVLRQGKKVEIEGKIPVAIAPDVHQRTRIVIRGDDDEAPPPPRPPEPPRAPERP